MSIFASSDIIIHSIKSLSRLLKVVLLEKERNVIAVPLLVHNNNNIFIKRQFVGYLGWPSYAVWQTSEGPGHVWVKQRGTSATTEFYFMST